MWQHQSEGSRQSGANSEGVKGRALLVQQRVGLPATNRSTSVRTKNTVFKLLKQKPDQATGRTHGHHGGFSHALQRHNKQNQTQQAPRGNLSDVYRTCAEKYSSQGPSGPDVTMCWMVRQASSVSKDGGPAHSVISNETNYTNSKPQGQRKKHNGNAKPGWCAKH